MTSPVPAFPNRRAATSAGCRKKDGVPVLESVAEIFRRSGRICPFGDGDAALQARRMSTAFAKVASSRL